MIELVNGFYSQKKTKKTSRNIVQVIAELEKSEKEVESMLLRLEEVAEPVENLEEKEDQSLAKAMEDVMRDRLPIHKCLVLSPREMRRAIKMEDDTDLFIENMDDV